MQNTHRLFIVPIIATSVFLMSMANAYAPGVLPPEKVAPPSTANVGEQKKITFTLTNLQSKQQPYVYIILITDEEGFTDQLSWVQGLLEADQEFRIYQSWIPEKPGEYNVKIFLWNSMDVSPLAPTWLMKVIVEE